MEEMRKLSPGIGIVHQIAAVETTLSRHKFIEPEHLFCAITKLEDFVSTDILATLGLPPEITPFYCAETSRLLDLFEQFNIAPRDVRRTLRMRLDDGGFTRENEQKHISRSPGSRMAFSRA